MLNYAHCSFLYILRFPACVYSLRLTCDTERGYSIQIPNFEPTRVVDIVRLEFIGIVIGFGLGACDQITVTTNSAKPGGDTGNNTAGTLAYPRGSCSLGLRDSYRILPLLFACMFRQHAQVVKRHDVAQDPEAQ